MEHVKNDGENSDLNDFMDRGGCEDNDKDNQERILVEHVIIKNPGEFIENEAQQLESVQIMEIIIKSVQIEIDNWNREDASSYEESKEIVQHKAKTKKAVWIGKKWNLAIFVRKCTLKSQTNLTVQAYDFVIKLH